MRHDQALLKLYVQVQHIAVGMCVLADGTDWWRVSVCLQVMS